MERRAASLILGPVMLITALASAPAGAKTPARPRKSPPRSAAARPPAAPEEERISLEIPALRTQEQVAEVVGALVRLRGVQSAIVDLKTCLAVVQFDPALTRLPQFLTACQEAGYPATEYRVEDRFPKPVKLKGG
jgi:hypothetical protein